jgi:WD40 repeat protein
MEKNMKKMKILALTTIFLLVLMTLSGCLSINGRVPIQFLHFSDDGAKLVSLTEFVHTISREGGHMLQLWDVETGNELFSKFHSSIAWNHEAVVYFSPDNNYLILPNFNGNYTNKTCIFDWRNDEIVTNFSEKFHDWSDDGKYLALENSEHNIEIWNATSFEVVQEVNVTIARGQTMSFSPNSSELAFVKHHEKCLYLYHLSTGTIRQLENSSFTFNNIFPNRLYIL